MTHFIGTDIGIIAIKTVFTDIKGEVRATVYPEYTVLNPHLGWAEQLPEIRAQAACGS